MYESAGLQESRRVTRDRDLPDKQTYEYHSLAVAGAAGVLVPSIAKAAYLDVGDVVSNPILSTILFYDLINPSSSHLELASCVKPAGKKERKKESELHAYMAAAACWLDRVLVTNQPAGLRRPTDDSSDT